MSSFEDLERYLDQLPDQVLEDAAEIVAETAVEYYKDSFTRKEFDGNPWVPGSAKKTGSLMVESSNLMNSITPVVINRERVVISAGNDKVKYAKAHNEGFQGTVTINPFTRSNGQQVKQHTREMRLPKRQFIGKAEALANAIKARLNQFLKPNKQ